MTNRKASITLCACLGLTLFLTQACKKSNSPSSFSDSNDDGTIQATAVYPLQPHGGDTLIIRGKHLGKDTAQFQLTVAESANLANYHLLHAYQAKDSFVSFILPPASQLTYVGQRYYGSRPFDLTFFVKDSNYLANFTTTVFNAEPKGWFEVFVQSPALDYAGLPMAHVSTVFPSDSIGYWHSASYVWKTRDGGDSWTKLSIGTSSTYNLSVLDTGNCWISDGSSLYVTADGGTSWQQHPLGIQDDAIGGAMYSTTSGLLAGMHNVIYSFSGGFDPSSNMTKEYSYSGTDELLTTFSAVDKNNLLAAGDSANNSFIVAKQNGQYDAYSLSSSLAAYQIEQVQLVTPTLGFALDEQHHLLRYMGNRNWTLLSQQASAVFFVNALEGFVYFDGAIYETSDAGSTWQTAVTLQTGDVIYNFSAHNGKIWATGNNTSTSRGTAILYKYNP